MTTPIPVPHSQEIVEELRHFYADTLGIPIDKVTADADLAADLGIDSLTQEELMVLVLERYGMSALARDIQATSYPTIGALADLVERMHDEGYGRHEQPAR